MFERVFGGDDGVAYTLLAVTLGSTCPLCILCFITAGPDGGARLPAAAII